MKKIIKIGIMMLFVVLTLQLTSCKTNTSATGEIKLVESNRKTLEIEVTINDPKSEVTASSVQIILYDADDARVTSQSCSEILTTVDDVYITSEKEILTGLKSNTEYTAKLQCTVKDNAVVLAETKVSTTKNGDSEETPIMIKTIDDLAKMKNDLTASYKLANDLDFSAGETKTEFTPLFSSATSTSFTGTFDGGGYTISNFKQTASTTYYGFFGYLSAESKVKNVTFDSIETTVTRYSDTYAGIVAGYIAENTEIENVNVTNSTMTIKSTASQKTKMYVGGLVGQNMGASIANTNVTDVEITVTPSLECYVGGFIGSNASTHGNRIENSTAKTTLTVNQTSDRTTLEEEELIIQNVGGFIGRNENSGTINDCTSEGSITSSLAIAQDPAEINRNYNVQVGGFVGLNFGTIRRSATATSIDFKSFDAYRVSIGLFCGFLSDQYSKIENCVSIGTNQSFTLVLVDGDNDQTTTEKNEYDRIFNVGAIGYIAPSKTADDYNLYIVNPKDIIMSSAIESYSFAGTNSDYDSFELSDEVAASIARWLVLITE